MLILAALLAAATALAPGRFGTADQGIEVAPDAGDDDDPVMPPPRREIAI